MSTDYSLHAAAIQGDIEQITLLLNKGVDVNARGYVSYINHCVKFMFTVIAIMN
jgi:hypothetical protein